MDQSAQSVLLITLGVIPLRAAFSVALSQKVMSEISQKIKSVIRFVIKVTTMSEFNMVAEQVRTAQSRHHTMASVDQICTSNPSSQRLLEVFPEGLAMEVLSSFHPIKPMPRDLPKCKMDTLYLIKAVISLQHGE
eukprot:2909185-Amphidinium_carterae.1